MEEGRKKMGVVQTKSVMKGREGDKLEKAWRKCKERRKEGAKDGSGNGKNEV